MIMTTMKIYAQMKQLSLKIYLVYGPVIGTSVFVFGLHLMIFSIDPLNFLQDLIKPSILLSMLFYMIFALVFGYLIGITPAMISAELFYAWMRKYPQQRQLNDYIYCGFLAAIPWMLVAAVATMFYPEIWSLTLCLSCTTMISSMACAAYIWRKMTQLDQAITPELPKTSA